jgi:hypothetical protein
MADRRGEVFYGRGAGATVLGTAIEIYPFSKLRQRPEPQQCK